MSLIIEVPGPRPFSTIGTVGHHPKTVFLNNIEEGRLPYDQYRIVVTKAIVCEDAIEVKGLVPIGVCKRLLKMRHESINEWQDVKQYPMLQ